MGGLRETLNGCTDINDILEISNVSGFTSLLQPRDSDAGVVVDVSRDGVYVIIDNSSYCTLGDEVIVDNWVINDSYVCLTDSGKLFRTTDGCVWVEIAFEGLKRMPIALQEHSTPTHTILYSRSKHVGILFDRRSGDVEYHQYKNFVDFVTSTDLYSDSEMVSGELFLTSTDHGAIIPVNTFHKLCGDDVVRQYTKEGPIVPQSLLLNMFNTSYGIVLASGIEFYLLRHGETLWERHPFGSNEQFVERFYECGDDLFVFSTGSRVMMLDFKELIAGNVKSASCIIQSYESELDRICFDGKYIYALHNFGDKTVRIKFNFSA